MRFSSRSFSIQWSIWQSDAIQSINISWNILRLRSIWLRSIDLIAVTSEEKKISNALGTISLIYQRERQDRPGWMSEGRRRHGGGKDVDYTKRAIHINKLVFADTRYRNLVHLLSWRRPSATEIPSLIRAAIQRHRRLQTSAEAEITGLIRCCVGYQGRRRVVFFYFDR